MTAEHTGCACFMELEYFRLRQHHAVVAESRAEPEQPQTNRREQILATEQILEPASRSLQL